MLDPTMVPGAEPVAQSSAQVVQSLEGSAGAGAIRRSRGEGGWALDLVIGLEGASLSLHAVPSADAARVWRSISIPAGGDVACTSRALVDGQRFDMAVSGRFPTSNPDEQC